VIVEVADIYLWYYLNVSLPDCINGERHGKCSPWRWKLPSQPTESHLACGASTTA
jgi:hypothetical protein